MQTGFNGDGLPVGFPMDSLRQLWPAVATFCEQHDFVCRRLPRGYQFSKAGIHLCWWPRGDTMRIQGRMNGRYCPRAEEQNERVLEALGYIQSELDKEQERMSY